MTDYELLYYIYQNDEEALRLLLKKHKNGMDCLIRRLLKRYGYEFESSDEFTELQNMAEMETYLAAFNYRDDGTCSFTVYVEKCVEMGLRKHMRQRRCYANKMMTHALRLDEKVRESEGIYHADLLENKNTDFEGHTILKWYHEKNVLEYLANHLKESEFVIVRMKLEGYSQKEIAARLMITVKQVYYVCAKVKKLLRSYID